MRLTNYFIKKKIQYAASRASARKHEFCALEEAKVVLVLFQAIDAPVVEPCLEQLRKMGKKVYACMYASEGITPEKDSSYILVNEKEHTDAWYAPKNAIVEQCKALQADILIDLCRHDCYPMQYIMLQHPCSFKTGRKFNGLDLYDLSIVVTEGDDIKYLFEQILFYLKAIRSK